MRDVPMLLAGPRHTCMAGGAGASAAAAAAVGVERSGGVGQGTRAGVASRVLRVAVRLEGWDRRSWT